jgi:magnesium-transporting ATPase (P-type)
MAGMVLMMEPAQADLMTEPPRDIKRERLVPLRLVAYSYLFYGMTQSVASFVTWFYYMASRGPTGILPTPLPPVDNPAWDAFYPVGYTPAQTTFAWNWGV